MLAPCRACSPPIGGSWEIDPSRLVFVRRDDGELLTLGSGGYGTVRCVSKELMMADGTTVASMTGMCKQVFRAVLDGTHHVAGEPWALLHPALWL